MWICNARLVLLVTITATVTWAQDFKPAPVHAAQVQIPTRAQLDYAAWVDNSLFPPRTVRTEVGAQTLLSAAMPGVSQWSGQFPNLGLSAADTEQRLSYAALRRETFQHLRWDIFHRLQASLDSIGGGGWEFTRIFLGRESRGWWLWRRTQPVMWLQAQSARPATPPMWAQVQLETLSGDTLQRWLEWIGSDYAQTPLDSAGVLEWAQVLASYWYPSLNTDLVWDLPAGSWPHGAVETSVREFLGERSFDAPTLLIRGNPLGDPHYTLIAVPGMGPVARRALAEGGGEGKLADRNLPENYVRNMERWAAELQIHGGAWAAWEQKVAHYRDSLRAVLNRMPADQMGWEGEGGWLFFRRNLEYLVGGDIGAQQSPHTPLTPLIEFKGLLEESEVNMLFVPIPAKEEVFPERVSAGLGKALAGVSPVPMLHPWGRKFLVDAQDEGMEVIDLLPHFLQQKESAGAEPLFQEDDTHWTSRGLELTAQILAQRIQQYNWYAGIGPEPQRYSTRDTSFSRLGDIVDRLPADRQSAHPPQTLRATQVFLDGKPYRAGRQAPILLIGDSFTGVYELTDCRHAGLASHIARLTGLEVETITSWGGGPNVRNRVLRARGNALGPKRLVIYLMTARDLWNYGEGWEPLQRTSPEGDTP